MLDSAKTIRCDPHFVTSREPDWWCSFWGETRHVDISDIWQEATDPENERGEVCTACLFRRDDDEFFTLRGVCVDDGVKSYHKADWVERVLGQAAIWNIEQHEWEA